MWNESITWKYRNCFCLEHSRGEYITGFGVVFLLPFDSDEQFLHIYVRMHDPANETKVIVMLPGHKVH